MTTNWRGIKLFRDKNEISRILHNNNNNNKKKSNNNNFYFYILKQINLLIKINFLIIIHF